MKHESNRPLSSRPISAIFVRPQGFMEYSNVTWSPRGMTADESCYYRKPWSSSFSSQPHSQGFSVSIGGNVVGLLLPSGNASSSRAKCTARLSCHCLFLLETSTTQRSSQNILCIFQLTERRGILENNWFIPSIQEHKFWSSQICSWTFVSLSLSSGDIFLASKNDKTQLNHLNLLDCKTFFIL